MNILDSWISKKHCITGITQLRQHQLDCLRVSVLQMSRASAFYQKRLAGLPPLNTLDDLALYPTMDKSDLLEAANAICCVSQHDIARVFTFHTSGTTGKAKRIFFTEQDQHSTIDFFVHGMREVTGPGESVAVFLPCNSESGVSDLLAKALTSIGVKPLLHGPVGDLSQAADLLAQSGAASIVAAPVQALGLAEYCSHHGIKTCIRSALLSSDSLPVSVRRRIVKLWGCGVFDHYGMTEFGFGGALECESHDGLHIRENDLFFEILDERGHALPEGEWGEIAVTTLNQQAMPLLRYRTGDESRFIPGPCGCKSILRRIAPPRRKAGRLTAILDEAVLSIPEVIDYHAEKKNGIIHVDVQNISSASRLTYSGKRSAT